MQRSTDRAEIQAEVTEIEARLARIEADPKQYAMERVAEIDEAIQGRKGGPGAIEPRETAPGHISMHTHLQSVREAYRHGNLAQVEIAGLRQQIQRRQAELTLMPYLGDKDARS